MGATFAGVGLVVVLLLGRSASASESQAAKDVGAFETSTETQRDPVVDTTSERTAAGAASDGGRPLTAWPCWLVIPQELREVVGLAWDHSPTFRHQCQTLGAAGAVLLVQSSRKVASAGAQIGLSPEGVLVARILVCRCPKAAEYLAHELEHVLERVEGVNYLMELGRVGSGVTQSAGAFETVRADTAGRRVAAEMDAGTRASDRAKKRSPDVVPAS